MAEKVKKTTIPVDLMVYFKHAFILFVMTPDVQTIGNIVVYGSVKQLVI